jgi:hypothetical protein
VVWAGVYSVPRPISIISDLSLSFVPFDGKNLEPLLRSLGRATAF